MSNRIKLRRNTSTYWATHDFTPSDGEPIVELDTNMMKIGDGIKLYSELPYAGQFNIESNKTETTGFDNNTLLKTSANKTISASAGIDYARPNTPSDYGTGTPNNSNYLRGDGTWQIIDTELKYNTTATSGFSDNIALISSSNKLSNATNQSNYPGLKITDTPSFTGVNLSGSVSANAWTTNGIGLYTTSRNITDLTSSGTVSAAYTNVLGGNIIAASSSATYTDYGTLYLSVPTAGSNVVMTNKYSLVTAGNAKFNGSVSASSFSGNGSNLTNVPATDSTKLPLAGGTMTGAIVGNISSGASLVLKPLTDSVSAVQVQNSTGTNILNIDSTNGRVGVGSNISAQAGTFIVRVGTDQNLLVRSMGNSLHLDAGNDANTNYVSMNFYASNYNMSAAGSNYTITQNSFSTGTSIGIGTSSFGSGSARLLAINNSTAPTTIPSSTTSQVWSTSSGLSIMPAAGSGTATYTFGPSAATFPGNISSLGPIYKYKTFTDSNNYERLTLDTATYSSASYMILSAESSGSGSNNLNLVLSPKGTGAITAQMPDGTTAGGNARGSYAVDLQMGRSAAAQVASGQYAFAAGYGNTVTGKAAAAFGELNKLSTDDTFAAGYSNTVTYGACAIGNYNSCTGLLAVALGSSHNASATSAFAAGSSAKADRYGMSALASGQFDAVGDAQRTDFVLRCKTTTNAAVEMALNGTTTYLTIPSGKILSGTINIQGIKSDGSASCHYMRQFSIKNVSGDTSLIYEPIVIGTDYASGTSISITANDTGDYLSIQVTGITSETWRWTAHVEGVETAYGT